MSADPKDYCHRCGMPWMHCDCMLNHGLPIKNFTQNNIKKIIMQNPDSLNQVAEFHKTFHSPVEPVPVIPSVDRQSLRLSLLSEELHELQEAMESDNIVEIADAFCDLQYVLSGAILEFGMGNKFKALFEEVHRSNMSKACDTLQEALDTISHYKTNSGVEAGYREDNGKFLVYRVSDNKTLKSINYSPAALADILK